MPFFVDHDRIYPASMIFTVEIEGQRFNFTGDTSTEAAQLCAHRYGEYLKSDLAQLSHHESDDSAPRVFYMLIDPNNVFIPGTATNGASEKWGRLNVIDKGEKVFLCSSVGTITLTLPYN